MKWTWPICSNCYDDLFPGRQPVRLIDPDDEICSECGITTDDGIYIRRNPNEVTYS